jgi:hypothetical protein
MNEHTAKVVGDITFAVVIGECLYFMYKFFGPIYHNK